MDSSGQTMVGLLAHHEGLLALGSEGRGSISGSWVLLITPQAVPGVGALPCRSQTVPAPAPSHPPLHFLNLKETGEGAKARLRASKAGGVGQSRGPTLSCG